MTLFITTKVAELGGVSHYHVEETSAFFYWQTCWVILSIFSGVFT